MSSLAAVLDASVLFPAAIRDTLLRAAGTGLYQLYWSDEILEEVRRNLVKSGRATPEPAQRLVDTMQRAFPEAMVVGYEGLIDRVANHPKDRHVLAAAVMGHAHIIVTDNLRDFPDEALAPFNLESYSADAFLTLLFDSAPDLMVQTVIQQTNDLRSPPKTYIAVLDSLGKQAPTFAAKVRKQIADASGIS